MSKLETALAALETAVAAVEGAWETRTIESHRLAAEVGRLETERAEDARLRLEAAEAVKAALAELRDQATPDAPGPDDA